ncbi:MAG: hypothetical protein LR011_13070 [Verrucomicrobia bacterium]|nr:hypothetical protein [Verrucomicrobiota bacterium]
MTTNEVIGFACIMADVHSEVFFRTGWPRDIGWESADGGCDIQTERENDVGDQYVPYGNSGMKNGDVVWFWSLWGHEKCEPYGLMELSEGSTGRAEIFGLRICECERRGEYEFNYF